MSINGKQTFHNCEPAQSLNKLKYLIVLILEEEEFLGKDGLPL